MNRASPAELRKELGAAQAMVSAGILFVPMPVLNSNDHASLRAEVFKRMDQIIGRTDKESSHDNQ